MSTPLTMAETASVFGETVDLRAPPGRRHRTRADRLSLLSERIDGADRHRLPPGGHEPASRTAHPHDTADGGRALGRALRRAVGETQAADVRRRHGSHRGLRTWWSSIWHCFGAPGTCTRYAFGQLLALSVYRRYEEDGAAFVPRYLEMLGAGGSRAPEELGRLVGCDLADPGFWHGGLAIIEAQIDAAEVAARRPPAG